MKNIIIFLAMLCIAGCDELADATLDMNYKAFKCKNCNIYPTISVRHDSHENTVYLVKCEKCNQSISSGCYLYSEGMKTIELWNRRNIPDIED